MRKLNQSVTLDWSLDLGCFGLIQYTKTRTSTKRYVVMFLYRYFEILHIVFVCCFWTKCFFVAKDIHYVKSVLTGSFLVCIFPHSRWIRKLIQEMFVISPNAGKCRPEKLRIPTVFMHWLKYMEVSSCFYAQTLVALIPVASLTAYREMRKVQ